MNLHATEASREHYPADMSSADVRDWSDVDVWPGDTWGRYTYTSAHTHDGRPAWTYDPG